MASEKSEIGHGVTLELVPMGVHTVAPDVPGEMMILQPPRIENWMVARGVHKQQLEIGGNLLEISYLLGSARGKEGCGDANMIMTTAVPGILAIISETTDYLSQPKNDPNWKRILDFRGRNFLTGELPGDEEKIRWNRADVAGADLQRTFPNDEQAKHLKRSLIDNLFQITSDLHPMRWREQEYVPVQEKVSNLMLMNWLEARNDFRWERLRRLIAEINKYEDLWRNYWMNAAIAALGMVINTGAKGKYENRYAGVAEVVSNADVNQLWGVGGLYYGSDPVFSGFDKPGIPGVGDTNRKFDWLAKQAKLATESGLVGDVEYHEKTAPDGVYMTWGPREFKNREWLTWAIARAFHATQTENMSTEGKTIFAQDTDGITNETRNPDRDTIGATTTFSKRARILVDEGPVALAKEIVNGAETPSDDYYMLVVEVNTKPG